MSKLPDPVSKLQGEDLALYQNLVAKRGRIDGMYRSLLNHPELTRHISNLGTYLRFESTLPGDIREFIILSTASYYRVGYEWVKHQPVAENANLSFEVIEAVKQQRFSQLPERYLSFHDLVMVVIENKNIPVESQNKIISICGIKGLLEAVTLVGFYHMIGSFIFAFDVDIPPGTQAPF